MFALLIGNLADGFQFFGPFESTEDAEEFATNNNFEDWNIVELCKPSDPEGVFG